ncbi:MAG: hypothetical protein IPK97_11380 [Ahniella sp.]|nr:hypothetical protein [Ahniella sp.]
MNPAVGEIGEAWQQRWPALRLAHLYASPGEREAGLLTVVLALELGAARFALSDAQLATRKLGFWAEEFDAGAEARHPLSKAIGLRRSGVNPAALFLADLEDALPEDVDAQWRRWKKMGAALASATGGGSQEAAVYPLLWAAYDCLAVAKACRWRRFPCPYWPGADPDQRWPCRCHGSMHGPFTSLGRSCRTMSFPAGADSASWLWKPCMA